MRAHLKTLSAALLGAGIAIVGTAGAWSPSSWFGKSDGAPPAGALAGQAVTAAPAAAMAANATQATAPTWQPGQTPNYRAIAQTYGPAVVGVTVAGTHKVGGNQDGDDDDADAAQTTPLNPNDPFFRFFRGLPGFGARMPSQNVPFRGQGSGFILSSDGLVLTNAHVVRDAKEVTVKLSDRREFKAKVLGADADTDIAVLRIDAKGLPTVKLGDPRTLQVGDYVLAIGAPFGFEQSATQGIVSAKGRSLPGDNYVPFIQTDAAVNPGNSGGPLFDASGAVMGVNAQIYSRTGGYQGLSFAIPIDVALKVKDQIVASGHATHARMGVQIQDINQGLAESFGLSKPDGALVAAVVPGSPAAQGGLQSGDVVLAINGQPIERAGDLSSRVGMATPGEKVTLKVWRERAERELTVKLGNAHDAQEQAAANGPSGQAQLGLALRPLNPNERQATELDHGLVIERVSGAAARAGLQPGDVVLAINGRPVDGIDKIRSVLDKKPKSVALLIQRGNDQIFVPVNLG
jgi:serine protease Do